MKINNFLTSILCSILFIALTSCASEDFSNDPTVIKDDVIGLGHISMEQAYDRLNMLLEQSMIKLQATSLVENVITKSIAYNEKGEILTRGEEENAYYYVFYIGDSGSYAIMSATDQLPELIAFSEGGKDADEMEEPASNFMRYIRSLPDSLNIEIGTGDVVADSLAYYYYNNQTTYELLNGVRPMDLAWSDGYPFIRPFDYVSSIPKPSKGIPAITTELFLMHPNMRPNIEKPSDYMAMASDTIPYYHWDAMYNVKNESDYKNGNVTYEVICDIGILLRQAWRCFGQPGEDWYGSYSIGEYYDELITRIVPVFENMFGIQGGVREEFDLNNAITEIAYEGYPIIIIHYGPFDGLMWVSDAVLMEKTPYVVYNTRTAAVVDRGTRITYLLYCNWGNHGKDNGYYLPDLMIEKTGGVDENGNPLNSKASITPPDEAVFWDSTHMFYGGRPIR